MANNKAGFTEEQQAMLLRVTRLALRSANMVTVVMQAAPKQSAEDIGAVLGEMIIFAEKEYPLGPLSLRAELEEVAHFCDLPQIFIAEKDGARLDA